VVDLISTNERADGGDRVAELTGNKAIEDAAIKWVVELERAAGRLAEDTRYTGSAGDVESPPRVIEVKAAGRTCRGNDLWLETRQPGFFTGVTALSPWLQPYHFDHGFPVRG